MLWPFGVGWNGDSWWSLFLLPHGALPQRKEALEMAGRDRHSEGNAGERPSTHTADHSTGLYFFDAMLVAHGLEIAFKVWLCSLADNHAEHCYICRKEFKPMRKIGRSVFGACGCRLYQGDLPDWAKGRS